MTESEPVAIGTDEVLGTLTYTHGGGGDDPVIFEGWVRRSVYNHNQIVVRRYRGRNWWFLVSSENVISFQPKVKS